ncbi:MAG: hypothetical protein K8F91_25245 [Candidatus Obscuribacterales bacterium]|nr:hypothetical protein [Candidatus Obscuribacterales bacterium]
MTYQIIPLLVACIALVAGMLLGKRLAVSKKTSVLRIPFLAGLLMLVVFGNAATAWTVGALTSIGLNDMGLPNAAAYISTGLLSLVTGFLFGHFLGSMSKSQNTSKESEEPDDHNQPGGRK